MKYENIVVQDGQSIWDICVRYYGAMSSMTLLLTDNNLTLNDELTSGQVLKIRSNLRTRDRNSVREIFDQSKFTINNHSGVLADMSEAALPAKYVTSPIVKTPLQVANSWRVQDGQSLMDVAVQWYGTVEAINLLTNDNNLSLNDSVKSGDVLTLREDLVRLRIDQNVINNNDNYDQITGELRVLLSDVSNETQHNLGWIIIDVLGGSAPYSYEWRNETDVLISTSQNLISIGAGTYTVTVTDAEMTVATLTVTISSTIIYNYLIDQFNDIIIDEVGDGILVG
jgi:hypothetical protein